MDRRCEQALAELWSATDPVESGSAEGVAEARTHVESCRPCRDYLKRDASLRRRLSEVRVSTELCAYPSDARHVLLERLDAENSAEADVVPISTRRQSRWPAWTGAAAAMALIAGGLAVSWTADAPVADGAFVADFIQASLPEMPAGDHTVAQVAAFYEEQFGDRMVPARLLDAPVRRVAVCNVEGRRGAMVEYDFNGERLVYYQLPLDGDRGTDGLRTARDGGYNVARWGDHRSEHVIVSAMAVPELEKLAKQRMN